MSLDNVYGRYDFVQLSLKTSPYHKMIMVIILWVLSGISMRYGAASAQILAIYENFSVLVVSVLLLPNCLFLLKTPPEKKGSGRARQQANYSMSFPFSVLRME